jgi:hypothetical protein
MFVLLNPVDMKVKNTISRQSFVESFGSEVK